MFCSTSKREKHPRRILQFFRKSGKNNSQSADSVQDQMMRPSLEQTPDHSFRAAELEERVKELERLLRKETREKKQQKELFQQKEMFLEESLADAQLNHQNALETISQLEEEKSELHNSVKKLQSRVRRLSHARHQSDELQTEYEQKQGAHIALLLKKEELVKELMQKDEVLKDSLSDAQLSHQNALETISKLEKEKTELTKSVKNLQSKVRRLSHARRQSDTKYKKQLDAHKALQLEKEKLMNELMQKDEVMKDSLSEAQLREQNSLETISQLEEEKSELTESMKKLHLKLQDLWNARRERDELQTECDKKQEAYNTLQLKFEEMEKKMTLKVEVLKVELAAAKSKHQKALQSIRQLEEESELKKSLKKLHLKVVDLSHALDQSDETKTDSPSDAQLSHLNSLKAISQLEKEKSELTNSLKKLHLKLRKLWNARRERDELQTEYDKKQEAYNTLQLKFEEMEKKMTQKVEVLKMNLAAAKSKHQEALQSISQLDEEKSELMNGVDRLRLTGEGLKENFSLFQFQLDELQIEAPESVSLLSE